MAAKNKAGARRLSVAKARAVVARTDPNQQESVERYNVTAELRECEP
ncbi:MAG: hypothetical protein J5I92_01160 [Thiogranum sp.]|nr:hypothetical protein [Thiogranum sp.]